MPTKTILPRIIDRAIPATIGHEDERCIILRDIPTQAPVHRLIVPKEPIARMAAVATADAAVLGHLLLAAQTVAKKLNLANGFRLAINKGPDACESVPRLHVHLLAGRQMTWPPE